MNIERLIREVREYNDFKEPSTIRVIIGKSSVNEFIQDYHPVHKKIDIYEHFGHFAFLVKKWKTSSKDAECCAWSLLLGCNMNDAKEFLNHIKKEELVDNLIEYLYYKYGIVMVNREGYVSKFKYFKNKKVNVTHILVVSDYSYKRVLDCFNKNVKAGIVCHPSKKNWGVQKESTWIKKEDYYIERISYNGKTFDLVSLKDFIVQ